MVTHIATFASSNALFNDTLRLQANYATAQNQSSSGLKSADSYQGVAGDAQSLISLESQLNNINAQANAIKGAQNFITATQNATSNITDLLSQVASLFSGTLGQVDSAINTGSNILSQATSMRTQLISLLNTQVAGRYVFGGNIQNKAPVDITDPAYNTATPSASTPDTNYYQGDTAIQTVRASDSLSVSYGITADNPAFEQALRALNLAIANPSNLSTITQSYTMTKDALSSVADITGGLNAKNTILDNELSYQSSVASYLSDTISGLRDADVAAATVQATQIETQMQASYGILSKVLNLRLSDYLRG